MKNLLFGLIASIIFGCTAIAQNQIKPEDFGFYHNEGLELLKDSKSEWVKKDINEILDFATNQMAIKYPKLFSDIDLEELHKVYEGHVYGKFSYEDCIIIWKTNKQEYIKNNKLSFVSAKVIDKIISDNLTVDEALNEFENALKNKDLNENDVNSLTAGKSLLKSSDEFWTANPNSYTKAKPIRSRIADLVVGLMFFESGPFAAIAGFAASEFVTASGQ
ncbi:hypothetical protein [Flavobacterium sp.]|uniref:hypothetical protein n=1 Tax=Flavobacterium sp. TaxID=239 RepID=UPI003752A519